MEPQAEARVKLSADIPYELWKRAKSYAAERRIRLREVVVQALEAFLDKK
jgi:macrodomain Ter protein organizer (MatP/YcbG family)